MDNNGVVLDPVISWPSGIEGDSAPQAADGGAEIDGARTTIIGNTNKQLQHVPNVDTNTVQQQHAHSSTITIGNSEQQQPLPNADTTHIGSIGELQPNNLTTEEERTEKEHIIQGRAGKALKVAKRLAKQELAMKRKRDAAELATLKLEEIKKRSRMYFCTVPGCNRAYQTSHYMQLHQQSEKCPDAGTQVLLI